VQHCCAASASWLKVVQKGGVGKGGIGPVDCPCFKEKRRKGRIFLLLSRPRSHLSKSAPGIKGTAAIIERKREKDRRPSSPAINRTPAKSKGGKALVYVGNDDWQSAGEKEGGVCSRFLIIRPPKKEPRSGSIPFVSFKRNPMGEGKKGRGGGETFRRFRHAGVSKRKKRKSARAPSCSRSSISKKEGREEKAGVTCRLNFFLAAQEEGKGRTRKVWL